MLPAVLRQVLFLKPNFLVYNIPDACRRGGIEINRTSSVTLDFCSVLKKSGHFAREVGGPRKRKACSEPAHLLLASRVLGEFCGTLFPGALH